MNLLASIGHTPLIRLTNVVPKNSAEVWVKYEGNNPTGSYKDRVALGVIKKAMARGDLKAGDRICEYTGGSTGTSIAFVSSVLGLKFTAVSSSVFANVLFSILISQIFKLFNRILSLFTSSNSF